MKSIAILPPIEFETTSGKKLPKSATEFISLSQLEFCLMMAGEAIFTAGMKGRRAARFQADAKAEIGRAFGSVGDGMISEPVARLLAAAVEETTISFRYGSQEFGPAIVWCLLPFMDAIANARDVAPVEAQPAEQPAPLTPVA